MELAVGITFFLTFLHIVVFTYHNKYRFKKLRWFLDTLYTKGIIKREDYLALNNEYDYDPFDFSTFQLWSSWASLPDDFECADLGKDAAYIKFADRHNGVTRYFHRAIIILFLIMFCLAGFSPKG
jgi:hypothetical protein